MCKTSRECVQICLSWWASELLPNGWRVKPEDWKENDVLPAGWSMNKFLPSGWMMAKMVMPSGWVAKQVLPNGWKTRVSGSLCVSILLLLD